MSFDANSSETTNATKLLNWFANPKTKFRIRKRFKGGYANHIMIYTPMLPNLPQITFLLIYEFLVTIIIIGILLLLVRYSWEVNRYFYDMARKLVFCGTYESLDEEVAIRTEGYRVLPRGPRKSISGSSELAGDEGDAIENMPRKSSHRNFFRRGSIVRLNLAFAHDLATLISLVDGKI